MLTTKIKFDIVVQVAPQHRGYRQERKSI